MRNHLNINVSGIVGPNNDHDDGHRIYGAVQAAIQAGYIACLDFTGIDILTPSFLNTSFRVLARQYSYDFIKSRIDIVNSNAFINTMIRDAVRGKT